MLVQAISGPGFQAGNVILRKMTKEDITEHYDRYKEFAEINNADIVISKAKDSKCLADEDMYIAVVAKDVPSMQISPRRNKIGIYGMGVALTDKKTPKNEVAEKIFTAVKSAIEILNLKIENFTKRPANLKL